LGFFIWQVSQYFTRRYGPRHRQDAALTAALKKLDNRYTLVSFAAPRLPDYLLLGPHGIHVLVPRDVSGTVRCKGDRWSRAETPKLFSFILGDPLRNPTAEATQSLQVLERHLQAELDPAAAEAVPIAVSVVLTNPKVTLEADGCRFPAVRVRDLPQHVRRDKGTVPPDQVAQLRRLFSPADAPSPPDRAASARSR
jgi:hypothetical protein